MGDAVFGNYVSGVDRKRRPVAPWEGSTQEVRSIQLRSIFSKGHFNGRGVRIGEN